MKNEEVQHLKDALNNTQQELNAVKNGMENTEKNAL